MFEVLKAETKRTSEKLNMTDQVFDDVNDDYNDASDAVDGVIEVGRRRKICWRFRKYKRYFLLAILVSIIIWLIYLFTQLYHGHRGIPPVVFDETMVQQLRSPPEIEEAKHFSHMRMVKRKSEDQVPFSLIVGVDQTETFYRVYCVTSTEVTLAGTASGDYYFSDGSQSSLYFASDDIAYFSLGNGELWKIDGSRRKMELVKDLRIDNDGNTRSGYYEFDFHILNDEMYFLVHPYPGEPTRLGEIWKSDGTTDGTIMVSYLDHLSVKGLSCVFQDAIYFVGNEMELWKLDGMGQDTMMVESFDSSKIGKVAAVDNDYLLLLLDNNQVRVSDGRKPSKVVASNNEKDSSKFTFGLFETDQGLALQVGERALFTSTSGTWATQGKPETTVQISEVGAEWDIPRFDIRSSHVEYGENQVLLSVFNGGLVLTDGTIEGTKRINVTSDEAVQLGVLEYKDELSSWDYFGQFLPIANDGKQTFLTKQIDFDSHPKLGNNVSLWVTDGTDNGTEMIETIFNTGTSKVVQWKDNQALLRTNNQLWALSESRAQLLLEFQDSAYFADLNVFCSLEDGGLVMPVQPNEDSPLEFWSVAIGAMPVSNYQSIAHAIWWATALLVIVLLVLGWEENARRNAEAPSDLELSVRSFSDHPDSYNDDIVQGSTFM